MYTGKSVSAIPSSGNIGRTSIVFRLYWSTSSPVTPPFVHPLLTSGTRYQYILTAVTSGLETAGTGEVSVIPPRALAPDFVLPDVNPGSSTFNQPVSPRDHIGRVSAWYFAHAT